MIEGKTIEYGKHCEIRIIKKRLDEKDGEKIDVRVWQSFPNQAEPFPTRKGLFLAPELWELIIREVQKLIKEDAISS